MLSHDQKIYINLDRYGEQTLLLWTIPNLITASVFHIHLILNIASCFYNHENASWRFLYCSIWSIPLDSTTHIYCQLRIEQSRSFRLALLKIGHARNKTKTKLSCKKSQFIMENSLHRDTTLKQTTIHITNNIYLGNISQKNLKLDPS